MCKQSYFDLTLQWWWRKISWLFKKLGGVHILRDQGGGGGFQMITFDHEGEGGFGQ